MVFQCTHFLPAFDPKQGQMQKKNCHYGDGNIEKQAPCFRSGFNLVPPKMSKNSLTLNKLPR